MKHLLVKPTDDEILPVFAQFFWSLKCILLRSNRKLFLVLFQVIIETYILSF